MSRSAKETKEATGREGSEVDGRAKTVQSRRTMIQNVTRCGHCNNAKKTSNNSTGLQARKRREHYSLKVTRLPHPTPPRAHGVRAAEDLQKLKEKQ